MKFVLPPWQAARALPPSPCAGQQRIYKLVFVTDKTEKQKHTLNSRNSFKVITKASAPPASARILQRAVAGGLGARSGEAPLGGTEGLAGAGRWFPLL